jgi:hypothetical protein
MQPMPRNFSSKFRRCKMLPLHNNCFSKEILKRFSSRKDLLNNSIKSSISCNNTFNRKTTSSSKQAQAVLISAASVSKHPQYATTANKSNFRVARKQFKTRQTSDVQFLQSSQSRRKLCRSTDQFPNTIT